MQNFLQQFRAFFDSLDPSRRNFLYASIASTLVLLVAVGWWSSQVSWSALITGRTYDEMLEAAAALDAQQIEYKIDGQGRLMVPVGDLGKARAAVSQAEILPGLADIAELKLGLTPKAQQWAFLRAKEGDLSRMVNGIAGVSGSRVQVVPRRDSLFLDETEPARASVFLKMRPGRDLGASQTRAIVNLVANSVEGLSPEAVSVVDDRGNLLAEGRIEPIGSAKSGSDPLELLDYRKEVERRYERAVSQAILPILGYDGGFSVTANVDLNTSTVDHTSYILDVDKQAMLSEQLEESESTEQDPGGVPGVDANLPERAAPANNTASRSITSAITSNFQYPADLKETHTPAGDIERVSVAVQVDSAAIASLAEAAGIPVEDLQKQISEAVQAAVGYDEIRKDNVSVTFLPFAEVDWDATDVPVSGSIATDAASLAPSAVAALALLLVFWFIVRPLVQRVTSQPTRAGGGASGVSGLPDDLVGALRASDPDADLAQRLRLLVDNYQPVDASDLNRLVSRESDAAAQVLRQWKRRKEG